MVHKVEKIVFFAIILFLPVQLGKHFWPPFSFVSGVRVDYLSPTVYVTDLLIIVLLFIAVIKLFFERIPRKVEAELRSNTMIGSRLCSNNNIKNNPLSKLFPIFILVLFLSTVFAKSPWAGVFGLIKLFEFSFLGIYVAKRFQKRDLSLLTAIFSIDTVFVSLIAILQFVKQGSIGGALYYLGERTFNSSTIGIANMDINGQLILRPYSTFPHPNVLAFFLFFVNILLLHRLSFEKDKTKKVLLFLTVIVSSITLFLTFARLIIFLYIVFLFFTFIKQVKRKTIFLLPFLIFSLMIYFSNFYYRFFDARFFLNDLLLRKDLIDISLLIFKDHPYFGIGVNNFFYHAALYQKTITPTLFQPVHNIFILTLVETGIFGFLFLCTFLIKSLLVLREKVRKTKNEEVKNFYNAILFIFIAMIIVGLFDHFFLTVQQGQLMMALILGFMWAGI